MKNLIFIYATMIACLLQPNIFQAQTAELSERRLMQPSGWWWLTGVSADQISQKIEEGFRIFDLEVESVSPLRFSTAMVKNQEDHKKSWWWYYGLTSEQVGQKINQHHARLIDLEVYFVNGNARYALVMVSNSGSEQKAWWYYSKLTFEQLQAKLDEKRGRLLDLDTYTVGSERFFSAVMVPNQDSERKAWWYYTNLSAEEVKSKLDQHKARLTDIEVRSQSGGKIAFTVVMEKLTGETWWWYYGKTKNEIKEIAAQHGARITDVEPYTTESGQKRFAVLLLRNTNDLTNSMRHYLAEKRKGGAYGFYLKRVDGNVLASLQAEKTFYPASTIKVLQHVHAIRAVQVGNVELSTNVVKYENTGQSCQNSHTGHAASNVSLEIILRTMMENSDNQSTNALQEFFGNGNSATGRQAMNRTAHNVLQMSDQTMLNHKFDCGGPDNNPANSLTLIDLGRLYERVASGLLNSTNTNRFDALMNNMGLNAVIDEEAAKLGVNAANVQLFKSQLQSRSKGGSIGDKYKSIGGWVSLPIRNGDHRQYVFGLFIDDAEQIGDRNIMNKGGAELLRQSINQALATFK